MAQANFPHDDERTVAHPRTYATSLDDATCKVCADLAGNEYSLDDSEAPEIPNPRCTHSGGCRCRWL